MGELCKNDLILSCSPFKLILYYIFCTQYSEYFVRPYFKPPYHESYILMRNPPSAKKLSCVYDLFLKKFENPKNLDMKSHEKIIYQILYSHILWWTDGFYLSLSSEMIRPFKIHKKIYWHIQVCNLSLSTNFSNLFV